MRAQAGRLAILTLLGIIGATAAVADLKSALHDVRDYYAIKEPRNASAVFLAHSRFDYGKKLLIRMSGIVGVPDNTAPPMVGIRGGKLVEGSAPTPEGSAEAADGGTQRPRIAIGGALGKLLGGSGRSAQGRAQRGSALKARPFTEDERVYPVGLEAHACDSEECLDFMIVSEETRDTRTFTGQFAGIQRLWVKLRFYFPAGYLATARTADIVAAIAPVFVTEEDVKVSARPAKTIALGQTQGDVRQALGEPDKIVDLGSKVIFIYKDMRVVFADGKVSDVQ